MARTHVVLPEELLEQIDRLVGRRRRSRFLAEAAGEKLRRSLLLAALRGSRGVLREEDYPEWRTPEDVAAWVEVLRREDQERRL